MQNNTTIWIDNPNTRPAWNLAAEEHLLTAREGVAAMIWRNERSVIIGRNQDLHSEVDMDFARDNGIAVVRRLSGGGAVFHDLGNVNYTFIAPHDGGRGADFGFFARPLIAALARMGVNAELSGRNDLLVDGLKVSGCAHARLRDRALYHGTLLFDANLTDMAGVLKVNKGKYESKGIASVASRVGNLAAWLSTAQRPMDVECFMERLRAELLAGGSFVQTAFSAEDVRAIDRLCAEKYESLAWTDGARRGAERRGQVRTPGGSVEAWLSLCHGRIERVRLTGDFFGVTPVAEVEALLSGLPFERQTVADALPGELLERALHNVPKEALLDALFADCPR